MAKGEKIKGRELAWGLAFILGGLALGAVLA
jgi:hypothetical protein